MMNLNKISIGQAGEIAKYYFEALDKSDGIFKINLLEPYTIHDVINSFKLLNAYKLYSKSHSIKEIKQFAEEGSAAIILYHIGFSDQESEKAKLSSSKNVEEYISESIKRCLGEDENTKSFFQYCTQIRDSHNFWEMVYSRLHILYDINDIYLSKYFKDNIYDFPSRMKFLKCLISFEFALNAIEKDDIDLAFDELTNAYEGLKSLHETYKNNATFYYYKGRIEFLGGNPQAALNNLTKSINLNPNFGFSFYYRAIVNAKLQNTRDQENDFSLAEKRGITREK